MSNSLTASAGGSRARREFLFSAACLVGAAALCTPAVFAARRSARARRLSMTNSRTGEELDIIYHIDGEYVDEALFAVNYFMRDWRQNETREIDVRTLDILAAMHNMLETSEPFQLISGYRTPATNRLLQEGSSGVASSSLHVKGMAADIRLNSRSTRQISSAALRCQAGGVGTYLQSGFVHVDCGRVRQW